MTLVIDRHEVVGGRPHARRRRIGALARTEARLLWRFGAVAATVAVTGGWVAVLLAAPVDARDALLAVVLLTDVAALGFLFVPALLLVERMERTDALLRLTPVRTAERVGVRLALITGLSILAGLGVSLVAGSAGVGTRLLGVVLLAVLFGLVAFAVAGHATTLTDFLVAAPLVAAPLIAPALVHLLALTRSGLLYLSPVTSAVDLLRGELTWVSVGWPLLWIVGVAGIVARSARRPPPDGRAGVLAARQGGARTEAAGPDARRSDRRSWPAHPGVYRAGTAVRSFVRADRRTVLRHGVAIMLFASVPLLTVAMRLVATVGVTWAERRHGIALAPHLPLLEAVILVVHVPVVFGSLTGLLLLEDRDAGLFGPLTATRAGMRTLLGYRLGATALLTAGALALLLPLDGVPHPAGAGGTLATAVAAGVVSTVPALVMATTAANRVQGVAVMKILGLPLYVPLATWVLAGPSRWAFAPLPTSWVVWASWAATPEAAIAGAAGAMVVTAALARLLAPRFFRSSAGVEVIGAR